MDVCVVLLYNKDKRHSQDNHDNVVIQIKYRQKKKKIPPGTGMVVVSVGCLSGRGLCDGLITRPEEFYRLWCVILCDLETSRMRRLKPASGL
jgi:hypothetical protein